MNSPTFDKLRTIYALFDSETGSLPLVCQKGCALCCTDHLSLTTLEARYLAEYLAGNEEARQRIRSARISWRPAYTVNGLVLDTLCRRPSPPEDEDSPVGACPLLSDDLCLAYPARPLACRVMFSRTSCSDSREGAEISPLDMSLNQVFMQAVEHLDSSGRSGNLVGMMALVEGKSGGEELLHNRPMPGFLIPPEHQDELRNVVRALKDILEER
ncbi:MAG: YkgJ family cysteine cluster protein [Deltaproteobacteria bacterium]|nr:YkgJ family cysteine cluster protein [Deltaproteobacteria bacterium]